MTDEQIIQSLPPGLQGDLKEFGPLECKSSGEIHRFLLNMRGKYDIAPWHAFTLLMKRAAHAANDTGRGATRRNAWCYRLVHDEKDYTTELEPRSSWVFIKLKSQRPDGTPIGESDVAVQPSTKRIWLMASESLHKAHRSVFIRANDNEDSKAYSGQVRIPYILETAKKAIRQNLTEVEINHKIRYCEKHKNEQPLQEQEAPQQEQQQELDLFSASVPTPEQPKAMFTDVQREVLTMVFELGAAKARELGMHSTISRWRTELAPILGPEVYHVND